MCVMDPFFYALLLDCVRLVIIVTVLFAAPLFSLRLLGP